MKRISLKDSTEILKLIESDRGIRFNGVGGFKVGDYVMMKGSSKRSRPPYQISFTEQCFGWDHQMNAIYNTPWKILSICIEKVSRAKINANFELEGDIDVEKIKVLSPESLTYVFASSDLYIAS